MTPTTWIGSELTGSLTPQRYRVTRPLSEGGMASVYHAKSSIGADVVVKTPLPALLSDAHFLARFEREVRTMSKIRHPHIVPLLDSGSHDGRPFVVVPYYSGGTLAAKQGGPVGPLVRMSVDSALSWLEPIAAAVDYLHGRDLYHRDLKPENIFFDAGGRPVLADFGIVKVAAENPTGVATVFTQPGMVLGTPSYMAPEQIMGRPLDRKIDIYALGVMVFEWLTATVPYEGTNPALVLAKQLSQSRNRLNPADLEAQVSREIGEVVSKAMAFNPADRFESAIEFAETFKRAIGAPASASAPAPVIRAKPPSHAEVLLPPPAPPVAIPPVAVPKPTSEAPMSIAIKLGNNRQVLRELRNLIGRANECQVRVPGGDDSVVSWEHASLEFVNGVPVVTDLGSTNGTFHNGTRLAKNRPSQVRPGDRIRFGLKGPELLIEAIEPVAASPVVIVSPPPAIVPAQPFEAPPIERAKPEILRPSREETPDREPIARDPVHRGRRGPTHSQLHRAVRNLRGQKRTAWILAIVIGAVSLLGVIAVLAMTLIDRKKTEPTPPTTPATTPAPGTEPNPEKSRELAQKARAVFEKHCFECHGKPGNVKGKFDHVLERDKMTTSKRLLPNNPSGSKVYNRMADKDMPPEDVPIRPTDAEIGSIKEWIEGGAPDLGKKDTSGAFLTNGAVLGMIHADLEGAPPEERVFRRYFTFTHLANAGVPEDKLLNYRIGLTKLINSLSRQKEVKVPEAIDPAKTILRIDLRHYGWDEATWEKFLAAYTFRVAYSVASANKSFTLCGTTQPSVRADWFVFEASRPPLYHEILKLPATDRELEKGLGIDVAKNIAETRSGQTQSAARAGFNGSLVSKNNRMIERHSLPDGGGAYWKSYDFAVGLALKNIFDHPLGPGPGANEFKHDGGEIIFNLPNGLQAYYLTDAKGGLIAKGPLEVVSDPKQPEKAVLNGVSCMSCHTQGMLDKSDQIRKHVIGSRTGFGRAEREEILALYPEKSVLERLMKEDGDRFVKAAKACGVDFSKTEPITDLTRQFEKDLDLKLTAAEVGVTADEFRGGLARSPKLERLFGTLRSDGTTIQRQVLNAHFQELAEVMQPYN